MSESISELVYEDATNFDEENLPTPIQTSVKNVTRSLGISPQTLKKLEAGLPLVYTKNISPLANGAVGVARLEGKTVIEMGFRQHLLGSGKLLEKEALAEETVHYLHYTANPRLVEKSLLRGELGENRERISTSAALLESVMDYARQNIDDFTERAGLDESGEASRISHLRGAILYAIGIDDESVFDPNTINPKLSLGQLSRICRLLAERELITFDKSANNNAFEYEYHIQRGIYPRRGEPDYDHHVRWDEDAHEAKRYATNTFSKQIRGLLISPSFTQNNELVEEIESIFEEALVPVERFGYEVKTIEKQINNLSPSQLHASLTSFLSQPCTVRELYTFGYLLRSETGWSQYIYDLGDLENYPPENAETIRSEYQNRLSNALATIEPDKLDLKIGRYALLELFDRSRTTSVAKALIDKRVFLHLEDLPADSKARANLLQNREYMKTMQEVISKALMDPNNSLFGQAQLDPRNFSRDTLSASQETKKLLDESLESPETAAFLADLRQEVSYNTAGVGMKLPEKLEVEFFDDIDRILLEQGFPIGRIPTQTEYETARQLAVSRSMGRLKKDQELAALDHETQILLEPIAKVITAQLLGRNKEDVVFPQGFISGYSELLRTSDFTGWVGKLWGFVEHGKSSGNGQIFLDFFQAGSLEKQVAVVDKVLAQSSKS